MEPFANPIPKMHASLDLRFCPAPFTVQNRTNPTQPLRKHKGTNLISQAVPAKIQNPQASYQSTAASKVSAVPTYFIRQPGYEAGFTDKRKLRKMVSMNNPSINSSFRSHIKFFPSASAELSNTETLRHFTPAKKRIGEQIKFCIAGRIPQAPNTITSQAATERYYDRIQFPSQKQPQQAQIRTITFEPQMQTQPEYEQILKELSNGQQEGIKGGRKMLWLMMLAFYGIVVFALLASRI